MGLPKKRILYLSFYFEPDLSAGSFRNTTLAKTLAKEVEGQAEIDLFTTMPNRYSTFKQQAVAEEQMGNLKVHRIEVPAHQSGMKDQIFTFKAFSQEVYKRTKNESYDLVFASSSRLFTAWMAARIAKKKKIPLYLDIRDIFYDTMIDVLHDKKLIRGLSLPVIKQIERQTFNAASHINLISGGFKSYFQQYKKPNYSNFPNGIDDQFLNLPPSSQEVKSPRTIVYAGNIGAGQGLHKIVPQAAKLLGEDYRFLIIGDGGAKQELIEAIAAEGVDNVQLKDPVQREELKEIYTASDYFFIHLNDYDAFKKVLPSKVFELGAYDKPIIAGVAGFANEFIDKHISNRILFLPGDVHSMVEQLKNYSYKTEKRHQFMEEFKRSAINENMARSIIKYL